MTRPKRFRDMGLTAIEAEYHTLCHWSFDRNAKDMMHGGRYWKIEARAKRLLPLWRKWGLEELAANSYLEGKIS